MHQPPIWWRDRPLGNLQKMLDSEPNSEEAWNAQWFAQAYKNPAKSAIELSQAGLHPRMMVDYSGVLLQELAQLSQDGTFADKVVDGEPLGDVIGLWRRALSAYPDAVEFAGTAYSHCYFPTTPQRDWTAQIQEWRHLFRDLFGEKALSRVKGFWLPEMGMMGEPKRALELIRVLKRCGYEWLILPASALKVPEGWTTPHLENRVHELEVVADGHAEAIRCVVRDTDMGIRQQSGQNADGCLSDIRDRLSVFETASLSPPPPLVVPTSDGENGNVMMFEYFKNTFAPLVKMVSASSDVDMVTVSEYIDTYLSFGRTTRVELNLAGGSWIGGHESWNEGDRRQAIARRIDRLSDRVAKMKQNKAPGWQEARKLLLVCETSCFVYWNSEFWFDQADRFLDKLEAMVSV